MKWGDVRPGDVFVSNTRIGRWARVYTLLALVDDDTCVWLSIDGVEKGQINTGDRMAEIGWTIVRDGRVLT